MIFIPAWAPEKMPPFVGYVVVWLLYAGFAIRLHAGLRQSQLEQPVVLAPISVPSKGRMLLTVIVALCLTMIGSLAPAELGFIPVWGVAIWIGLRMFCRSVRSVLADPTPPHQPKIDALLP